MNISDILNAQANHCCAKVTSKKKVLELLSEMLSQSCQSLTPQQVFCSLQERERLGSTGVGNGIAIPHGRVDLDQVHAAVVTTEIPISFDAIDNKPVDVFFAVLVPEDQCQQHIKVLSAIAKKLSNKETLKNIRRAQSDQILYSTVTAA